MGCPQSFFRGTILTAGFLVGLYVWGDQKATAQFSVQAQYRDAAAGDFTPTAFGQVLLDRGSASAGIPQVGMSGGGLGYISYTSIVSGNQVFASVAVANSSTLLTAKHVISDVNWNLAVRVGFGSDARNETGPIVELSQINVAAPPANISLDLVAIKIIVPGDNVRPLAIAPTRPLSLSTLNFSGYGYSGSVGEGLLPQDGKARGGDAKVGTGVGFGYDPSNYIRADLSPYTGLTYNIAGTGGTSGAPLFDSSGSLVGIAVASTVGNSNGTYNVQSTIFVDLTAPEANTYILNSMASPVSEPTMLFSLCAGAAFIGNFSRRVKKNLR